MAHQNNQNEYYLPVASFLLHVYFLYCKCYSHISVIKYTVSFSNTNLSQLNAYRKNGFVSHFTLDTLLYWISYILSYNSLIYAVVLLCYPYLMKVF